MCRNTHRLLLTAIVLLGLFRSATADEEGLPVKVPEREEAVSFEKEILPILRRNCLACHSGSKAEADLVLETPDSMRKGGDSGPVLIDRMSDESLIFLAAVQSGDTIMPPLDNKVGAESLTPEELGLLKLWIDQGALGDGGAGKKINWQPLAGRVRSIYAVDVTAYGRYAVAGLGDRLRVYQVDSQQVVGDLVDPSISEGIPAGRAHLDLVHSLAFSPDAEWIASGGFRNVKLWHRETPSQSWPLPEVCANPTSFAVSRDAQHAAIALPDGAVQLLALETDHAPKLTATLAGQPNPVAICFADNGATLLSATRAGELQEWAVASGELRGQRKIPNEITALTAGIGERLFATGSSDGVIRLWRTPAGSQDQDPAAAAEGSAPVAELSGHTGPVASLVAIGEGQLLASGSEDGSVRLWDVEQRKVVRTFDLGQPVGHVAISPDGKRLAAVGKQSSGKLWERESGKLIAELHFNLDRQLRATETRLEAELQKRVRDNAQKDLNAAKKQKTDQEGRLKKLNEDLKKAEEDVKKKQEAEKQKADAQKAADEKFATLEKAANEREQAAKQAEEALENANDDNRAALEKARDEAKKAFETAKAELEKAKEPREKAQKEAQQAVDQRKASERNVDASKETITRNEEQLTRANERITETEEALGKENQQLKAAETTRDERQKQFEQPSPPAASVTFSPDNIELAVVDQSGGVFTFATVDGKPLEVVAPKSPSLAASYVAKDRLAIVPTQGSVRVVGTRPVWRLARTIGSPDGESVLVDRVLALDFSPDGRRLATGGGEPSRGGELKIFDVESGALIKEVQNAHSDTVFAVTFSHDGNRLASCGADRFMKTFVLPEGKLADSFEGHTGHVLGVTWHPDGRVLATCAADNSVKVWDAINGGQQKTIDGFKKEVTSIQFLGQDDLLILGCGENQVVARKTDGGGGPTYGGSTDFVYCVRTSRDGKVVVAGGEDGKVRVWDRDGKALATFE